MRIYTGQIKNLYVKSFQINKDGLRVIETESVVVRKDAPFYRNFVDKMISFEYDTYLPTQSEAEAFVLDAAQKSTGANIDGATCLYADYSDMQRVDVSKEEFKTLKKKYRAIRKITKKR